MLQTRRMGVAGTPEAWEDVVKACLMLCRLHPFSMLNININILSVADYFVLFIKRKQRCHIEQANKHRCGYIGSPI